MKNNNLYLIGSAALIVGGILAYKKGVFGKKETTNEDIKKSQKDKEVQDALIAQAKKDAVSKIVIQNANSMKAKIAVIQLDLGVTPDGVIGQNTLNALRTKYPLIKNLDSKTIDALSAWIKGGKSIMNTPFPPTI